MSDEGRVAGEIPDAELVKRARTGDDVALGLLLRRHHAGAYRLAVSYVQDRDAAEDVVQEAFVKALRGLDRFRGDASFRTWVLRITANEAKGSLRRQGRRRESPIEAAREIASSDLDPAAAAALSDEAERARLVLATLPEKQRLSVSLRTEEGLSFREIGEITGSSEGAARVNYFHGIRRLRELME